ncbi:unnamed protein product, partial [Sphacelaria rigidula]
MFRVFSPDGAQEIPMLIYRCDGKVGISFSTGHSQAIWLRGEVLRPMISISPATHSFGPIHTERKGGATLFLGNPTYVDAEWSLSHIPAPPPKKSRKDTADAAPGFVDDPTVFFFKETSGTCVGVKLPLSSSAACLPEDWNRL